MASVENILKNIYGVTATGSLQNMSGGSSIKFPHISFSYNGFVLNDNETYNGEIRPTANIKYLDENNNMNGGACGGRGSKAMTAKKTKKAKRAANRVKGGANDIIYASAEYVKNNDLKDFVEKFYLYYRFSRSQNSAIYIIPPRNVLDKMINMRGKGEEGSAELQETTRNNKDKIGYERYLFVTFGNNSSKDKYRIVEDSKATNAYPNSSFGTLRRTNILGEVFYITCDDKMNVTIHTKPDNSQQGNKLTYIARFSNGGYVFQGEIPAKSLEVIPPKKANSRAFSSLCSKYVSNNFDNMVFGELSLAGGANNSSFELFNMYSDFYNHDIELAAEHFLKAVDRKGKLNAKYTQNGDLLYDAMYFAYSEPNAMNINDFGKESKIIMKNFKPSMKDEGFKNAVNNIKSKFNKIFKQCRQQNNFNKFIKSYKNIYSSKDISKMKADILTSYMRNNSLSSVIESQKLINDIFESDNINASQSSIVKNAFESAPLPSAFGTEYSPLFNNDDITFEKIIKNSSKSSTKQYNEEEDENYVSQIYSKKNKPKKRRAATEPGDEETTQTKSTTPTQAESDEEESNIMQEEQEQEDIEQEQEEIQKMREEQEISDSDDETTPKPKTEQEEINKGFSIADLY